MTDTEAMFAACRTRVGTLLGEDASIEDVERTIEAFPLPCEDQCELWLWAWSQLSIRSRRGSIRRHDNMSWTASSRSADRPASPAQASAEVAAEVQPVGDRQPVGVRAR